MKISYKHISYFILMIMLLALFIKNFCEDKESEALESHDKDLLDSLDRVNEDLLFMIQEKARQEDSLRSAFEKEISLMERDYGKKIDSIDVLDIDDHIKLLSRELSEED